MPYLRFTAFAALSLLLAQGAAAETPAPSGLAIELNAAETLGADCKLSFLITNSLTTPLDKAVFETVLFDQNGTVDRLTLFDFGALPVGRPRVRQFVVPQTSCENLGRVLFNGAQTCEGEGIVPDACILNLAPTSRTEIEVLG